MRFIRQIWSTHDIPAESDHSYDGNTHPYTCGPAATLRSFDKVTRDWSTCPSPPDGLPFHSSCVQALYFAPTPRIEVAQPTQTRTFLRKKKGEESRPSEEPVLLTRQLVESLFRLPLKDAASSLRMCPTALKKVCRKLGVFRWPYRARPRFAWRSKSAETRGLAAPAAPKQEAIEAPSEPARSSSFAAWDAEPNTLSRTSSTWSTWSSWSNQSDSEAPVFPSSRASAQDDLAAPPSAQLSPPSSCESIVSGKLCGKDGPTKAVAPPERVDDLSSMLQALDAEEQFAVMDDEMAYLSTGWPEIL
jgi:hypothetical protein